MKSIYFAYAVVEHKPCVIIISRHTSINTSTNSIAILQSLARKCFGLILCCKSTVVGFGKNVDNNTPILAFRSPLFHLKSFPTHDDRRIIGDKLSYKEQPLSQIFKFGDKLIDDDQLLVHLVIERKIAELHASLPYDDVSRELILGFKEKHCGYNNDVLDLLCQFVVQTLIKLKFE